MLTVLDSSIRSQTGGMENSRCKKPDEQVEDFGAECVIPKSAACPGFFAITEAVLCGVSVF